MMKRIISLALALVLTLAFIPMLAVGEFVFAATLGEGFMPLNTAEVYYYDQHGNQQGPVTARIVTAATGALDATAYEGWWVVQGDVHRTARTSTAFGASANLILADGAHLSGTGITVTTNGNLTIWAQSEGTGRLTAEPTSGGLAGITVGATNVLTINGGRITATGNGYGAGIGSNGVWTGTPAGTINICGRYFRNKKIEAREYRVLPAQSQNEHPSVQPIMTYKTK